MISTIQGILPAVITPFTPAGEVDEGALERLIVKLYTFEVDGLYVCGQTGDWTEARRIQDRLNELMTITLQHPMIPAIKKMLEWSGFSCGEALPPRRRLNAAEEAELRASLEAARFDPGGFLSGDEQL